MAETQAQEKEIIQRFPVKSIVINGLNPRKSGLGDLAGLRQSIVNLYNQTGEGLMQPLVVYPHKKDNKKVELIAGERRITAVREAIELKEIPNTYEPPCIVKNVTEEVALQMMFIENMQREDLSDYEQAVAFRDYLKKFPDPAAIDDLSEKTGINIHYIQRRAKILDLPESVLKLWQQGKLLFGHLEQLMRVDAEQAKQLAREVIEEESTVTDLKHWIDRNSMNFVNAIFDTKTAGCDTCQCSTKHQQKLFGNDISEAKKATCNNPVCFHANQIKALPENWKNHSSVKDQKTNGYVLKADKAELFVIYTAKAACLKCDKFVTVFDDKCSSSIYPVCNGDKACYAKTYSKKTAETTPPAEVSEKASKEKQKAKAENLAYDTAEKFYFENLPAVIMKKPEGVELARVQLLALIINNPGAWRATVEGRNMKGSAYEVDDKFIESVFTMKLTEIQAYIREISVQMVMSQKYFRLGKRRKVAEMFGLHIEKSFVMNKDYLMRKSKDQLIAMNKKFKILNLTEDALSQYKKTGLVDMFLKKNLKDIIPDEIVAVANGKYDKVYRTTVIESDKDKKE
jgi:ParB family chromosome partitioning protein